MRRPWNIIDTPVYSVATYLDDNVNMNICTYVGAVSRSPKLYTIAIECGSYTEELLLKNGICVIQLLNQDQMKWVKYLGYKSGASTNKELHLSRKQALGQWNNKTVLKDASAYLEGHVSSQQVTGDHRLFVLEITKSRTFSEEVLMFQDLIKNKVILG